MKQLTLLILLALTINLAANAPETNEENTADTQNVTEINADSTTEASLQLNIFEELSKPTEDGNRIFFHQSEAIQNLLIKTLAKDGHGFRIQIYSSNNGEHARWQALKIERKIKEELPNMSLYVTYTAPFWKVRIGNCVSQMDAKVLREFIMDKFPEYRTQTYIVPSKIEQ